MTVVALGHISPMDVHRAKFFGRCERKTGIVPFDRLVDQVMLQSPYKHARRVFWIVDNGSSHRGAKSALRLQKKYPNLILVHAPVHASWLNQIEIYFSILQLMALLSRPRKKYVSEFMNQCTKGRIRICNPALAGDAFVNQRLAVGNERGDLGFQVSDQPPRLQCDIFNMLSYPSLFCAWRQRKPKKLNSIYRQPWLRSCIGNITIYWPLHGLNKMYV